MRLYIYLVLILFISLSGYSQDTINNKFELTGFVDMHTHPRSDLAFGNELFYGTPYGDISTALGNCKSHHGAWGACNSQGNLFRSVLATQTEQQGDPVWKAAKKGYPNFTTWPAWCAILHQQMWIDWIERAHNGGLNVMVALAVSSHCISSAAKTSGAQDDATVLLNCIAGIKDMVAHSTFMEIAYSPNDIRRIVASGKLAVVLGSEMDNIGNFYTPQDNYKAKFNPAPSDVEIQTELDKLWDLGIRYIFPVHLTNTIFGGTSLAFSALNVSNKFNTGIEFLPEQVNTKETGIGFRLQHPSANLNAIAKMFLPYLLPKNVNPAIKGNYTYWDTLPGFGHRNSLGLTDRGRFGITYMMQKGFLIDIDHMSEKTANEVLDMAAQFNYPVNSGHNTLRTVAGEENNRTEKQYRQIKNVGGMVGMGHMDAATHFLTEFRKISAIMGDKNIGIGTDANGFKPLPPPNTKTPIEYDSTFTRCTTANRTWDINKDGMAHYGLLPDYIKSWEAAGMTPAEQKVFMSSAEHFTQMWEKCEGRKGMVAK